MYFGKDPDLLLLVLDVDFVVRHVWIEPGIQETFQAQTGVQSTRCHLNKFVGIFEKLLSFWNIWDVLVVPGEREFLN